MLTFLKNQATSWISQLFIGLLVLSFAVWGVSGAFIGYQADTVATVGETPVTTVEFARQYDLVLQNTMRQVGRQVTPDQAQLFGLPGQVLGRLVTQATLDDMAGQFGLGISSEALAKDIAENPAFVGPSGGFERLYFTQVLRNNGFNEDQYITDRRAVLLREQISKALVGGATVPDSYLRAFHELRSEERDISYITLEQADAGEIDDPSDSVLTTYFDENAGRWRAPEYRALALFEVTPSDIAAPDEISDEETQAYYDANNGRYTRPELRRVSQIHFDTQVEADKASEDLAGEKTFDDIVAERNLSTEDISLGLVTRELIIDQEVADAAFSISLNETSEVVEGEFGWVIARVEEIQPEVVRTFDEVKEEIKQNLAIELATRRIIGTFDEVEDARAGGETLAEISQKIGAQLKTIAAVDRGGLGEDRDRIADLPGGDAVVVGAFESDVGIENDAIRTEENGYVWYEVTDVIPESERVLADVRDSVVEAWKQNEIDKKLAEKADSILSRLQSGEPIADLAEDLAFEVKTATQLTRTMPATEDLSTSAIAAAFDGPKGHIGVADGPRTGAAKIVMLVTNTNVPSFDPGAADMVQMERQIASQIANDYLQQYLVEKQRELGVSVNQIVLQSVISGQPVGGGPGGQPFAPPLHGM